MYAFDVGRDPIWYRDVGVLARRPGEFFPSRDQTAEERVNSLVRMFVYSGIVVYAYSRKPKFAILSLTAIALVSIAYRSVRREHVEYTPARALASVGSQGQAGVGNMAHGTSSSTDGTHGSAGMGSASVGGSAGVGTGSKHGSQAGTSCTRSTPQNPFANVLLTDYTDNPDRPPACDYDSMKQDVRHNFNRGLIRDAGDVFEKENSQRQYFTTPVTTTYPDVQAFAQFCYGKPTGCKENTRRCTGFAG